MQNKDQVELIKKSLLEANMKAQDEFDIEVSILFNEARYDNPVKDWLKVFEELHRSAIVNATLRKANELFGSKYTLQNLGILDELAIIDPVKSANNLMLQMQADPVFKSLRTNFRELNRFGIRKSISQ